MFITSFAVHSVAPDSRQALATLKPKPSPGPVPETRRATQTAAEDLPAARVFGGIRALGIMSRLSVCYRLTKSGMVTIRVEGQDDGGAADVTIFRGLGCQGFQAQRSGTFKPNGNGSHDSVSGASVAPTAQASSAYLPHSDQRLGEV